jgi:hypothetical protein
MSQAQGSMALSVIAKDWKSSNWLLDSHKK